MVTQYRNEVGQNIGGKKLYDQLKNKMMKRNINIGRDKFFDVLRTNNLLVKKTKRFHITTDSKHHFRKHKNLIENAVPLAPEQIWVTDITYVKTEIGYHYLAIVTDAYSKKIMGYCIDDNMRTTLCINALKMALSNRKYPDRELIHHSDRGIQYCNPKYVEYAQENKLTISMTEKYDPYQNAIAERINRTLKYEYGLKNTLKNTKIAKMVTDNAVQIYNNKRPHLSLNYRTPNDVHQNPNIKYKSYRKNQQNLTELPINKLI